MSHQITTRAEESIFKEKKSVYIIPITIESVRKKEKLLGKTD